MTLDPGYTMAWILWALAFVLIEGPAICNRREGDTLSEHIWALASVREKGRGWRWRRLALLAALAWLGVHLLTGGWA